MMVILFVRNVGNHINKRDRKMEDVEEKYRILKDEYDRYSQLPIINSNWLKRNKPLLEAYEKIIRLKKQLK